MPVLDTAALINNRCEAIQKYHVEAGLPRAELDVSGGIDSATMLMLLAETLGPESVTAVYSSIHSSEASLQRARLVAKAADVRLIELDLTAVFDTVVQDALTKVEKAGYDMTEIRGRMGEEDAVLGSLRSCIRAPIGRFLNRMTGAGIRHGTGNEDEDRWLRFYQKGGDGEVDTNPLAMLSKGEVYQLANALHVPREILEALPTPDLWGTGEAHNDEEELSKLSGVEWTYSRINPETGKYTRVGTIERLSRFLDYQFPAWFDSMCRINGGWLFASDKGHDEISGPWEFNMNALVREAMAFFPGCSADQVRAWLTSARKWERITRHKMNPNCPTLGSRQELLDAGILTDELPEL